jgi:hypothetical protein
VLLLWRLVHDALPLEQALPRVPGLLPLLALVWALGLPFVRGPLFGARQTEYLRSLPVPGALVTAAIGFGLLAIDLPWVILCVASGAPAVMVTGPLLTAALHVAIASRRRPALLAVAALLALAAAVPSWVVAIPALVVVVRTAPWAWTVARTGRVSGVSRLHLPLPWLGLARATFTAVVLADAQVVRRGAGALVLSIAGAVLAVRNNGLFGLGPVLHACLVALAVVMPFISVRVTTGVVERGWELGWLYSATGAGRPTRTLGGVVATLMAGGILGGLHGLGVALLTQPALALTLVPTEALAGGGLVLITLGITAACVRSSAIEPGRLIAGHVTATAVAAVTLGGGVSAIVLLALLAAAVLVYHARVLPTATS